MSDGLPLLERTEEIARIRLQRARRHNRLQPQDLRQIREYLRTLEEDDSLRVLVLEAEGETFSSGFDLSSASGGQMDEPPEVVLQQLCDQLEAFPRPTICAVNGPVYGGASDLALSCDFRIGVRTALLRMPAVQLGICFYPSGLNRYVTRLGLAASKRLFLAAEEFAADELLRIGFLDTLVEDADALSGSVAVLAQRLSKARPKAAAYTKNALNQAARSELAFLEGDQAFRRSLGSAEFSDALKAWNQRKSQTKASS